MNDTLKLFEEKKICFKENLPASKFSSYRGGGEVRLAVYPKTILDLEIISQTVREKNIPFVIIGGGTNILIRDEGYSGLCIMTHQLKGLDTDGNIIKSGASERLPRIAAAAFGNELSGLEELGTIPATLGGAIAMNAGAFGVETKDIVKNISYFDMNLFHPMTVESSSVPWDYRSSGGFFRDKIITSAELVPLKKRSVEDISSKMCLLKRMRSSNQPSEPSLGCVFKNPGGISAGYYIDRAGLKGYSSGGASISSVHANFIVNNGGGTANDFILLMELMRSLVERKFDIKLSSEIIIP